MIGYALAVPPIPEEAPSSSSGGSSGDPDEPPEGYAK